MNDTEETPDPSTLFWFALANMLGYNELAKLAKNLGDKAYFRLLRERTKEEFIKAGGDPSVMFTPEPDDNVITIEVPYSNMPHIVFRARDVELMRDYVYKYDKERATT